MKWPHHDPCHEYYRSSGAATCRGRYVTIDGEPHFACEICREWCEGPCDGLTDDEVRQWENDRGEPRA